MTAHQDCGTGKPAWGGQPWHWAALVVLCLALYLPGLVVLPPFDRDEARFAQATRQMVTSGDYVSIHFQNEARLKKPVGIYWLQAASVRLSGVAPDQPLIWPYRLPSLLGALVAVLATGWVGVRLFGPTAGWLAAALLAGCVVLGVEARMAKTDAVLLATVVLAQGALARMWLERGADPAAGQGARPDLVWPLLFWLALAVSLLVKGPIGPMVSGLTLLALSLSEPRGHRLGRLRRLRPWLGLAVVLGVAGPWLIAIAVTSHGAFISESLGHDLLAKAAAGQEGKGLPPGYYLLSFWVTFAPFALPAALAVPWVWRQRGQPAVRFCLAWLVPSWLLFELVPTKLLHYSLPTFPAIALLTAAAVCSRFGSEATARALRGWRLLVTGLAALVGFGLAAALVVLPWLVERQLNWPGLGLEPGLTLTLPLALAVIGLFGLALGWWVGGRQRRALVAALAAMVLWSAAAYQVVLPAVDGLWPSRQIAQRVAALRRCPVQDSVLASAGYSEPSLVFLAGTATRLGSGAAAAEHLRDHPACALAFVEAEAEPAFRDRLQELALQGLAVRPLAEIAGFNYSKGRRVSGIVFAAEEGRP